jgi:hypothetical protein
MELLRKWIRVDDREAAPQCDFAKSSANNAAQRVNSFFNMAQRVHKSWQTVS